MILFFLCILAYLIGAIPAGLIVAKFSGIDITKQGSGNIGATNIARSIGKKAGIITLLIDVLKGYLSCQLDLNYAALLGLFAVLGHCFSLPVLKGGKGVATSLGVLLALNIYLAISAIGIFLISFLSSKIVSLSSILAALGIIISAWSLDNFDLNNRLAVSLIALCIIIRHHENIERLFYGQEKKFSFKPQA